MLIKQPELKIKRLREFKNFTQEYVASQLNISLRAYSKIESGETQLTIKRINEISEILDLSPIDLLLFDETCIFNNGSNTIVNNLHIATNIIIDHLQKTNLFLMDQNASLLNILEKRKLICSEPSPNKYIQNNNADLDCLL